MLIQDKFIGDLDKLYLEGGCYGLSILLKSILIMIVCVHFSDELRTLSLSKDLVRMSAAVERVELHGSCQTLRCSGEIRLKEAN